MNKLKNKLSNLGFAGVELILLVTIIAGIAAATRLAGEVQNLQKLAATGSCTGTPPADCWLNKNLTGKINTCTGREETNCKGLDTTFGGYCYNSQGQKIDACNWITSSVPSTTPSITPIKTPTSNPSKCSPPDYCSPNGEICQPGFTNAGKKDCSTGKYCCQKTSSGGVGGNACVWNGFVCTVGSASENCYIDTGGKECFQIKTCNRDPANCQAVAKPCVANPVTDCVCGGPGQAACGGGNPPPDGGNPPGGGAVTCSGGNGGKCSTASNPKCVGQRGNANCSDGGKCKELINQTGPDGLHKCNKQGGVGDPPPPVDPPPVDPPPNPPNPTIPPRECSDELSDEVCAPLKENSVCDAAGTTCINFNGIVDQQNPPQPKCTCGTPLPNPTATNTPTLTPTPTPTIDPDAPAWFAPDGSRCNSQSYRSFYNGLSDCENNANPVGYQTDNLPNQLYCTATSGINCYASSGDKLTSVPVAFKLSSDNICTNTSDLSESPASGDIYNNYFECKYLDPPKGKISIALSAIYGNNDKFDSIAIFMVNKNTSGDKIYLTNQVFSNNDENKNNDIESNKEINFDFNSLFVGNNYEVYAKVLDPGGVNNPSQGIEYKYNCINGENTAGSACTFNGEGQAIITINFPKKDENNDDDFDDLSGQALNNIFLEKIDAWTRGDLNAIQMSEFLLKVKDAPGLKTATCDPTVPGGCQPVF